MQLESTGPGESLVERLGGEQKEQLLGLWPE